MRKEVCVQRGYLEEGPAVPALLATGVCRFVQKPSGQPSVLRIKL